MRDVFFLALSQSLTSFPQISQTFPVAASTKIAILIKIKKKKMKTFFLINQKMEFQDLSFIDTCT